MKGYVVLQRPLLVFRVVASVQQATPARTAAKAVKDSEDRYSHVVSLIITEILCLSRP